jgi:hypothetical protein
LRIREHSSSIALANEKAKPTGKVKQRRCDCERVRGWNKQMKGKARVTQELLYIASGKNGLNNPAATQADAYSKGGLGRDLETT